MKLNEKFVIVKISGGLGNQMFQYAAGRSLAIKQKAKVKLDILGFGKDIPNETPRNYRLDVFPNNVGQFADVKQIDKTTPSFSLEKLNRIYKVLNKFFNFNKKYIVEKGLLFSEIVMDSNSIYLDGYWQSEKYFLSNADFIRNDFDLSYLKSNPDLELIIKKINSRESVSIHVRRGDYITNASANAHHGTCDLDYYYKAVNKIVEKLSIEVTFFIFSDDVSWCKENLKIKSEHFYVETSEDYHDLYLMSICKHNIIANSSFSWWGAWLNGNIYKNIIAPKKWFAADVATDLIPDNWIKI